MNILVVLPRIPYPLTDGGAIAQYSFLKHLASTNNSITIAALNTKKHYHSPEVLEQFGKVISFDIDTKIRPLKLLLSLFQFTPYIVSRFYSQQFTSILFELIEQKSIDTVIFETTFLGEYILDIREKHPTLDLFIRTHNTEFTIHKRLSKSSKGLKALFYKRSAQQLQSYELVLSKLVQGLLTVSDVDKKTFESIGVSTPIEVMPIGVDLERFPLYEQSRNENTYFFFGSLDWEPNLEGLHWFIDSVYPLIHKQEPKSTFHIGGKNAPSSFVEKCRKEGIVLHQSIQNSSVFFQTYSVMVAPLLSGSGTRVKILEALAVKTPMVTTTVGIEGINFKNSSVVLADDPTSFSNAVVNLLQKKSITEDLDAQRRFIEKEYNWGEIVKKAVVFMNAKKNQAYRTL